jgi:hypothetical protein
MSYQVYIPTRGRVGEDRQITLKQFKLRSTHTPILVCPDDEVMAHRTYHSKVWGCPLNGIGNKRQFILENACDDVVVMIDDDMKFFYRPVLKETTLLPIGSKLDDMLCDIVRMVYLYGYKHGGIGPRQGNNSKAKLWNSKTGEWEPKYHDKTFRNGFIDHNHLVMRNTRVNGVHFYHRQTALDARVNFGKLPLMEDFYVTLQLLTLGYPNITLHDYVWNQPQSSMEGGCSLYRTPELQAQAAEMLKAEFPEYVSVITKRSRSWGGEGMQERKDVRVNWLKAYRSSME